MYDISHFKTYEGKNAIVYEGDLIDIFYEIFKIKQKTYSLDQILAINMERSNPDLFKSPIDIPVGVMFHPDNKIKILKYDSFNKYMRRVLKTSGYCFCDDSFYRSLDGNEFIYSDLTQVCGKNLDDISYFVQSPVLSYIFEDKDNLKKYLKIVGGFDIEIFPKTSGNGSFSCEILNIGFNPESSIITTVDTNHRSGHRVLTYENSNIFYDMLDGLRKRLDFSKI